MKSEQGPLEKRENFGEKLRRAGKKGGQITPVATTFSRNYYKELKDISSNNDIDTLTPSFGISARKLGATLWELDHYNRPLAKMHHGGPRLRRLNHHQAGAEHLDPSPSSPDMPGSSGNLRRHIAALMQHHRLTERSNRAIQPVSPASYGSSMEIAPYNPAVTPSSSIDLQGRTRDANYSLRTSTELLKVLNRIWSLEEQHISTMSLVKAQKKELDHARSRIKELVREQQSDRHEMEQLMNQIAEDKLFRKNKEQEKINVMRDELEGERKLRKRSESLHRKLARELHDVKTSFSGVSKELEKERKSRDLLEDLCDEFALGIREYEKELHKMRQKCDEGWDERDELILHVSESWLDERLQMKMKTGQEKASAFDKLGPEIEAFLETKRNGNKNSNAKQVTRDHAKHRRNSLESIPLNMAVSAPQVDNDDDDDDNSAASDSNCFELKSHNDEKVKQKLGKKKPDPTQKTGLSPSSLQVKFEEQMANATLHDQEQMIITGQGKNPVEISEAEKGTTGFNSNNMIENLIRNHYLLSENGKKIESDKDYGSVSSIWRSHPSPVRQWSEKLPARELDVSESSSKLPSDLKENTLKAKLLEARTRGQRSRPRVKAASIIPASRNE